MTWPVLRGASIKHVTIIGMRCLLAVALSWALISCSVLYRSHGSLGIRCGLLATASDPYLDGSRKLFQKCSWLAMVIPVCSRNAAQRYFVPFRALKMAVSISASAG